MFRCSRGVPWAILLIFLISGLAWAQTASGPATQATSKSVITLRGTIQSVEATGVPMGTHLKVNSAGQVVDVYVGLKNMVGVDASAFHAGDTVQVTGRQISGVKGLMLTAWRVQDGDQVYVIRDAHGLPVNPGRRRP